MQTDTDIQAVYLTTGHNRACFTRTLAADMQPGIDSATFVDLYTQQLTSIAPPSNDGCSNAVNCSPLSAPPLPQSNQTLQLALQKPKRKQRQR